MHSFTPEQITFAIFIAASFLGAVTMLRILAIYRYKEIAPWDVAREANEVRRKYHQQMQRRQDQLSDGNTIV